MRIPLAGAILIALSSTVYARDPKPSVDVVQPPQAVESDANLIRVSHASSIAFKTTETDTHYLYGGPGSVLGKFQTALPDGSPDWQGWTGLDITDQPSWWQPSSFRSPTGTQAMWAGRTAEQEPGWVTAPGYGNDWNTSIVYRKAVSNPSAGQTVALSFVFHQDLEPDFDFFIVEYDVAGTTQTVLMHTGRTESPLHFPADVSVQQPIVYAGNDYGVDETITIRLRVETDGAWSDEDGYYPSDGAVQVDDIQVATSEGIDFEDFAGSAPYVWVPSKSPFAGLFAKIFARVSDLDPCRANETPVLGFIDDGTPASNPGGVLWNGEPIPSLGTTSTTWNYGVAGGWVFPYNGGLSGGLLPVSNEVWSPPLDWDLPGTSDDGMDVAGAVLRFDAYEHLPINNGICFAWQVRGRSAGDGSWTAWANRGFVYINQSAEWSNLRLEIGDLLPADRDLVQISLQALDLAGVFGFPGTDGTIAPILDNVSLAKYRIGGPSIVAREHELFNDSFPGSGLADASTPAARDLLDCRVDMASNVAGYLDDIIRAGDSLVVKVQSLIPGVAISDSLNRVRLHYSLNLNPVFEDAIRGNAPVTSVGTGLFGWNQHEGVVTAAPASRFGNNIADMYALDLPDADFMYPGDVLEYYIEAVDDDGRTTTLPADLSAYDDGAAGAPFHRSFQVRALPSIADTSGSQPRILFWNDFARRQADAALFSALQQNGMVEGSHYDCYETRAAQSTVDNGLGSASPNGRGHGATDAQLSGYDCILYESGDLTIGLISDGSVNGAVDLSLDVQALRTWFDQPDADRFIAHFGDNLARYMQSSTVAQTQYKTDVMGVTAPETDVRTAIGNQTAPHVLPSGLVPAFTSDFVAYGGCLAINLFDNIGPLTGAVRSHGFEVLGAPGTTYPAPGKAAGVVWDRMVGAGRKISVTFPFGMMYVHGVPKAQPSALATLLGEVFTLFDHAGGTPTAVPTPQRSLVVEAAAPNPFNPRTVLRFTLGRAARGDIEIFDLRGRSVRGLARDADFDAGPQQLVWDGKDDAGVEIASGVYLVRYRIDGFTKQQKLVLLR